MDQMKSQLMNTAVRCKLFCLKHRKLVLSCFTLLFVFMCCPTVLANKPGDTGNAIDAEGLIGSMIDIIVSIFQIVGIILLVYSIGQLIMAFKNEDADSKSRASTLMVVAIVLILLPGIVDGLNLTEYINLPTGSSNSPSTP